MRARGAYIVLPDPLRFSWDLDKFRSNAAKHGIEFPEAASVFEDPLGLIERSLRSHDDEQRFLLIGCTGSDPAKVIAVAFVIRDDQIRIFSARRASRDERRKYRSGEALS